MSNYFKENIKLVLSIAMCSLFVVVIFSNAIVHSADTQRDQTKTDNILTLSKNPTKNSLSFLSFFIRDWNWWENKPNMFAIPSGNVGIGTSDPDDYLDVAGTIHSMSGGFKFPDNTLQTSAAVGDGYSLNAADNDPLDVLFIDDNGSVFINTSGVSRKTLSNVKMNPEPNVNIDADLNLGMRAGSNINLRAGGSISIMGLLVNIIGNATIDGKLHVKGGIDPPYISFSKESHESIREYAKEVTNHEEVMQFWNGATHRMEIYVISEDRFYTMTGELIEG